MTTAAAQAVRWFTKIGDTFYEVYAIEHPHGRAWELFKRVGKRKPRWVSYVVHVDQHGAHCDCPSFSYRPNVLGCKHCKALRHLLPEML